MSGARSLLGREELSDKGQGGTRKMGPCPTGGRPLKQALRSQLTQAASSGQQVGKGPVISCYSFQMSASPLILCDFRSPWISLGVSLSGKQGPPPLPTECRDRTRELSAHLEVPGHQPRPSLGQLLAKCTFNNLPSLAPSRESMR